MALIPKSERSKGTCKFWALHPPSWASQVELMVKNLPANAGDIRTQVQSLGPDFLEEDMATHSSILAWRIPWTEEPGRLQSMGLQRVGHDWSDLVCSYLPGLTAYVGTLASTTRPAHLFSSLPCSPAQPPALSQSAARRSLRPLPLSYSCICCVTIYHTLSALERYQIFWFTVLLVTSPAQGDICICKADSCWCMEETNTIL